MAPVTPTARRWDRSLIRTCRRSTARLSEVGVLETPKAEGSYLTGQLFLHRVFGYRGIILFPWQARVYDRDSPAPVKSSDVPPEKGSNVFYVYVFYICGFYVCGKGEVKVFFLCLPLIASPLFRAQ